MAVHKEEQLSTDGRTGGSCTGASWHPCSLYTRSYRVDSSMGTELHHAFTAAYCNDGWRCGWARAPAILGLHPLRVRP